MKFLTAVALATLLYACSPGKLTTIQSDKVHLSGNTLMYENDTVKITYHFWDNKGRMSFDIYNKTDIPIYVDLKTSAFIPNGKMVSYWHDVTNTDGTFSSYTTLYGNSGNSKSKAVHQERIAVIPPLSQITQQDYTLLRSYNDIPLNGTYTEVNSPLQFRNFITISTNEHFEGKSNYIDNKFYVSKISKVKQGKLSKYKSDNMFFVFKKYAG